MTAINVRALQVRLGGLTSTDATVQLQCWAGDAPVVRVSGADVIVPVIETVRLAAGVPAAAIDYPPTLGTCCVKITVRAGAFLIERFVAIPEVGPVDFDDLVDVDPATFAPSVENVTAWQAWRDAAELLTATTATAAASANDDALATGQDRIAVAQLATVVEEDANRAGLSAFNAAGSAAAAQGSENAAGTARTGAEAARDLALAGQFAGASLGSVDLNTVETPGRYRQGGAASLALNYPVPLLGMLDVSRPAQPIAGAWVVQTYYPVENASAKGARVFYERVKFDTTWTPWRAYASQRTDQTAGRVILTYDDANGQEQSIYGDTGFRGISGLAVNGWSITIATIRRVGSVVSLGIFGANPAAATSDTILTVPGGFRPSSLYGGNTAHLVWTGNGVPTPVQFTTQGVMMARRDLGGIGQGAIALMTWTTTDTWPSVLPGTALGAIPNL